MQPLNVRMNNPGNLRPVGGTGFRQFSSPEEGLAQMKRDLGIKISGKSSAMKSRFGENYQPTLRNLITTWAPPEENDTESYINFVSKVTGLKPDDSLSPEHIDALTGAMIEQEGGSAAANYYKQYADAGNIATDATYDNSPYEDVDINSIKLDPVDYEDVDINAIKLDQPDENKPSLSRTLLEQSLQGATFGFSDEIMNRLGSAIASVKTGEDYSKLLEEAKRMSSDRLEQQLKQRLPESIAANILGGIGTGLAGASTGVGKAIASSVGAGGTGARIAKGALAGAVSGGLYGAGSGEEGSRLEGAAMGAGAGSALGGIIPAIVPAIKSVVGGTKTASSGLAVRGAEELDQAASAIKERSQQAYRAMRDSGAIINKPRVINISNKVEQAIKEVGKLNPTLHQKTLAVLNDFKDAVRQQDFSLEEMDQYRRLFGEVASGITEDSQRARVAIDAIDDAVEGLKPIDIRGGDSSAVKILSTARSEWSRYKKFETISDIVRRANGDPNKIKSGLNTLANNRKRMRGFSAEEKRAIIEAAKMSTGENILKGLGRFGIEPGNVFLPLVSGGLGAIGGAGPASGALIVSGTASRQLYKLVGRAKAENLLKLIEAGKPEEALRSIPAPKRQQIINIIQGSNAGLSQTVNGGKM